MADFFNQHSGEIIAGIFAIVNAVILPMVMVWLKEHLNTRRSARVETAIRAGLNAAIAAQTRGKNSRDTLRAILTDPEVRDAIVSEAQDYVKETVPQTVGKLKIDPALGKIISARVEQVVAELAERYITMNKAITVTSETDAATGDKAV